MPIYPDQEKQPLNFFILTVLLSIPLWIVGDRPLPVPVNLPVSALTAVAPALSAAILSFRSSGSSGVKQLFARAWDHQRIPHKIWYLPALLLPPFLYFLAYALMRLLGLPVPAQVNIPLLAIPLSFAIFYLTGAGEELGFSGYATEPVQNRLGVFKGGLLLGILWAAWHSIPFFQTNNPAPWIFWQSLKTVAMRMLIVWLYNRTGKSVQATILFHATDNVGWALFPNFGTYYNPRVMALLMVGVAALVFGWEARKTRQQNLYPRG